MAGLSPLSSLPPAFRAAIEASAAGTQTLAQDQLVGGLLTEEYDENGVGDGGTGFCGKHTDIYFDSVYCSCVNGATQYPNCIEKRCKDNGTAYKTVGMRNAVCADVICTSEIDIDRALVGGDVDIVALNNCGPESNGAELLAALRDQKAADVASAGEAKTTRYFVGGVFLIMVIVIGILLALVAKVALAKKPEKAGAGY